MIGIRQVFLVAADIPVAASVALVSTGLTFPMLVGQRFAIDAYIPITVGATGGVRLQTVIPAVPTTFSQAILLYDTIAPLVTSAYQTASAAFTNALANAGNHFMRVTGQITCGATAGNFDIQMACNTAANQLTILKGGWLQVTQMN